MQHTNESGPAVALTKCYFCGEDNTILVQSRNINVRDRRIESMHGMVVDMTPCSKCSDYMKQGVILITIDNAKSKPGWNKPEPGNDRFIPNPYRTGGFAVIKDEAVKRIFTPKEMADWAIKHRWMFIEHEAAVKMGLLSSAEKSETSTPTTNEPEKD